MDMYSECVKEREGNAVLSEEFGFIEYKITPPICAIYTVFVKPDQRREGKAKLLADKVCDLGRLAGCNELRAQVWVGSLNATDALKANLAYGFKVQSAEGNCILLSKSLGD